MSAQCQVICACARHHDGGSVQRLYDVVESLLAAGHSVLCLTAGELELAEHPNLKIHQVSLPCKSRDGFWFWFWFTLSVPLSLCVLAASTRRGAFVSVRTYYSALARPASLLFRLPIVTLLETLPWPPAPEVRSGRLKRKIGLIVDYLGLLASTRILTATAALQRDLSERIPLVEGRMSTLRPAFVLPKKEHETGQISSTDFPQWLADFPRRRRVLAEQLGIPERWFILATGGELTTRKNIESLVRAMSATENDRLALIVVGDGPEKVSLISIAAGLGLVDQMVFTGWSWDSYEIVGACDLFVMPSMFYGMSHLFVEALSAGAGVLASDVSDMREMLREEELLFPVGDVDALACRLTDIVGNRSRLEHVRKLSRERANELSRNWGQALTEVLSEII